MGCLRACLTVFLFLLAVEGATSPPAPHPRPTALALRSRAELDAWLQGQRLPTPLDALPPLARRRFLDSLVFGENGLGGYAFDDLVMELTPSQAAKILALFGLDPASSRLQTRWADGVAPPAVDAPSDIERDYDQLYRKLGQGPASLAEAKALYRKAFEPLSDQSTLARLSLRDLLHVARAGGNMAAATLDPIHHGHLFSAVRELERRGAAMPRDLRRALDGLLVMRRFDEAREFIASHPEAELPALPMLRDDLGAVDAHTVWRFDPMGRTLVRTPLDLGPAQILVTAGCHFSEDAATDIAADPALAPLFARHAQWLFLPPGQEDLEAAREWNRRFPQATVGLLHAWSEWTLLPEPWTMPTFLFVRDGKVVERIRGWPRDAGATRQQLLQVARRLSLIP